MDDSMNLKSISVDTFTRLIRENIEDEDFSPAMALGKSGIGKTESIYELTQELGIGFCELRLVTLNEIDLLGMPETIEYPDGSKRTTYASNDELPNASRDKECGILVLDEITSATSTIRAAAYQLMDSKRKLGNYKLPDKWKVVALGNGISDGGVFQGMESAFISRTQCYRVEPNLDAWKKWAIKNEVHPSVIAYLDFDPSKLHDMPKNSKLASAFPCPRSWTALSKKLKNAERRAGTLLDSDDVELYAAGAIGNNEAASFSAFYNYNKQTISVSDIVSGKADPSVVSSTEPEVMFIVIQGLTGYIRDLIKNDSSANGIDFSHDTIDKIARICKWMIAASEHRLDYTVTMLKGLTASLEEFRNITSINEEFEELCPEYFDFCVRTQIVFDAK